MCSLPAQCTIMQLRSMHPAFHEEIGKRSPHRFFRFSATLSIIVFVSHVCKSFDSGHTNKPISISFRVTRKGERGKQKRQIHCVNLRTVGNYNFRILHVSVPFFRRIFIVRLSSGVAGGKNWRRARYVEFFNKNDASVCAKWYGLFFLISLRMRAQWRIIYHVFFSFPSAHGSLWRFRMGYEYWLLRNESLIGTLMCNELGGGFGGKGGK